MIFTTLLKEYLLLCCNDWSCPWQCCIFIAITTRIWLFIRTKKLLIVIANSKMKFNFVSIIDWSLPSNDSHLQRSGIGEPFPACYRLIEMILLIVDVDYFMYAWSAFSLVIHNSNSLIESSQFYAHIYVVHLSLFVLEINASIVFLAGYPNNTSYVHPRPNQITLLLFKLFPRVLPIVLLKIVL